MGNEFPENNTVRETRFENVFRSLKYKNYRLFFYGQSISLIGTWMQRIATPWLVYSLTDSVFLLGLVGFAGQIPTFLIAPFAGVLIDRWNRYTILVITQILAMIQSLVLAFLFFDHSIQVWHIMLLSAFLGCINAFDMPARQSFVVDMIEKREDLGNAIALNSSMVNSARLIGPSIAGVLISRLAWAWARPAARVSSIATMKRFMVLPFISSRPAWRPSRGLVRPAAWRVRRP